MLLAQQDNRPLIEFTLSPLTEDHGIPLALMGIFVVFMALVLVVTFISVLPRALALFEEAKPEEPSSVSASGSDEEALPEELVVVIAAAVAQAIDRPHRIVRIRGLTPADLGWSLEGRIQQHQSHRIQHRARR